MAMQRSPLLMHIILDRGAKVAPNEEIVTATDDGVRRQSYLDTRNRAHQLAHALADAGVSPGDRVGTFMWNGARHLEAYHACAGMGAVLHTLNIRLSDKDLEYIIGHAQDKVIIADADTLPLLEALQGRMPSVEKIVVAAEPGFENWETSFDNAVDYESFIAGKSTQFDWPTIDENSPLGLCYTSGTTGNPKGVALSHHAVLNYAVDTDCIDLSSVRGFMGFSNISFDGSVFDLFLSLMNGKHLLFTTRDELNDIG